VLGTPRGVFDYFPPLPNCRYPTGYLGETFPVRFVEGATTSDVDRLIPGSHPPIESEYYELTDLFEAGLDAGRSFTFVEAGAGYGRWSARAALAAHRIGLEAHIVMIEGDPVHARWAREMMALKGIENFAVVEAAPAAERGKEFYVVAAPGFTEPAAWYGQSLARPVGLSLGAFAPRGGGLQSWINARLF